MAKNMLSCLWMIGDMLKIINVCFISAWEINYDLKLRPNMGERAAFLCAFFKLRISGKLKTKQRHFFSAYFLGIPR